MRWLACFLFAAFALVGACAPAPEGGSAAGAGPPLLGTEWRMVEFRPPGGAAPVIPGSDEVFTIRLDPNGSVAMQISCNCGTGSWTSADARARSGNLTIEGGAMTMAACLYGRIDRFQNDIPRIRRFAIDGNRLSLVLDDGQSTYVWTPQN